MNAFVILNCYSEKNSATTYRHSYDSGLKYRAVYGADISRKCQKNKFDSMSLINQELLCTSSSVDAPIYVLLKCKKTFGQTKKDQRKWNTSRRKRPALKM